MSVKVQSTELPGVLIVEPPVHRDARGFFLETYHRKQYQDAGIPGEFVQDNHSRSGAGTLRGLHLQVGRAQAKLVRVIAGRVWDVAVDVRRGSTTFKRWMGLELSSENFLQLYIPPGFAHGFYVLSPVAEVEYKCTDFYSPADEIGLRWDDPELAIRWPEGPRQLSAKDAAAPRLAEVLDRLPA